MYSGVHITGWGAPPQPLMPMTLATLDRCERERALRVRARVVLELCEEAMREYDDTAR